MKRFCLLQGFKVPGTHDTSFFVSSNIALFRRDEFCLMFDEALNATFGPKPENNGDEISHRSWPNYLRAAQDLNEINGTQGTPRCFLSSTSILANTSSRSGTTAVPVVRLIKSAMRGGDGGIQGAVGRNAAARSRTILISLNSPG